MLIYGQFYIKETENRREVTGYTESSIDTFKCQLMMKKACISLEKRDEISQIFLADLKR